MRNNKNYLIIFLLFWCFSASAQKENAIHWISFEQLSDSLAIHPKKVFIDFYTEWCTYCRKMDKVVFTNPEVVKELNTSYYAIRMDAESTDTLNFDGQLFINNQIGKTRTPIHQLAQILAMREDQFAPPTMIVLDEAFTIKNRYFQYLDSKKLLKALK